ncbi:MAG: site-2 protease family protein, partial [Thermoplasmata archaeon]|nr:site-2 protease family protein [Thermoplasmata archaeon]
MDSILLHPALILLYILVAWGVAMYLLWKKKVLEGSPFLVQGPFLLWRTEKGKKFINWLSKPKKFWKVYGDFSIAITFVVMFTFLVILIWVAFLVMQIPEDRVPSPQMIIGIPGLNPIIPIWYGILALVVALVVHEFTHGILTRVAKSRIVSLGLVFLVVPMGAFVEPDEEELKVMKKRKRSRMFASGPTSNLIVALVCSLVFTSMFIGSAEPKAVGNGIIGVVENSPAHNASLPSGSIITSIYHNGNDHPLNSSAAFPDLMDTTLPGDSVTLTLYDDGELVQEDVILANRTDDESIGYLGVYTIYTGTGMRIYSPRFYPESFEATMYSMIIYVSLPIRGLSPIDEPYTSFYEPSGVMGGVPESAFWVLANSFYWVFWLNLMLGLTNALPAVPLDGGYVFRDGLDTFLEKFRKKMKPERRERIVKSVSYFLSF